MRFYRSTIGRSVLAAAFVSLTLIPYSVMGSHAVGNTYAATMLKLASDKATWGSWFNAEGTAAQKATGVGWTTSSYADTNTYKAFIHTSGGTSSVPDLYTWWSGWQMTDVVGAHFATNLNSLWKKNAKAYGAGLRKAFTFNGNTYGAPLYMAWWVILYDKHTFAKYHLSVPKTWAQFMSVMKTLRSHGVTPLAATTSGSWPGFIYFEELLLRSNPTLYQKLMAGKVKYTNPGVLKVMNLWGSMIKAKDFSDPAAVTFGTAADNLPTYLKQGKIAMVNIGTWYEPTLTAAGLKMGRDIGAFIMPDINPSAGNNLIFESAPLVVAAHGSHRADAMKAESWFMSKAGQQAWAKATGFTPARSDVKAPSPVDRQLSRTINSGHYKLINRYWEATPFPIVNVAVQQFCKFMLNPSNPKAILQTIQHQADQTWASLKH
jgi:multiple sugar transport system substrate-binding protein